MEDRRVFNAVFALDQGALLLSDFSSAGQLTVTDSGESLGFQLDAAAGVWSGQLSDGLRLSDGNALLTVDKDAFAGFESSTSITIQSQQQNIALDVVFRDTITLPQVTEQGDLHITTAGDVHLGEQASALNDILKADGYGITVQSGGSISIDGTVQSESLAAVAVSSISLHGLLQASNEISLTSLEGALIDTNATALNIQADDLYLISKTGTGSGDAIEVSAKALSARNTDSGSVQIVQTAAGGDLTVHLIENLGRDVQLTVEAGSLLDGNDPVGAQPELNIAAGTVHLTAEHVGAHAERIFANAADPLEIKLTGDLFIDVDGAAWISGTVLGSTDLTAKSVSMQSDGDLDFRTVTTNGLVNLQLSADGDNDGQGNVLLGDSLTVSGDLALRGADIRTNRADGTLVLAAARLLIDSDAAETILLNPAQSAPGVAGLFDGRSATSLTVTSAEAITLSDLDADGLALSASATGDLSLTSAGTLTVSGKVSAGRAISLTTTVGMVRIAAQIDPATVTVTSVDDVVISSSVVASDQISITAGTDGSGGIDLQSIGSLTVDNAGNTGLIRLVAGTSSGEILLSGTVTADDRIQAQAAGGSINGGGQMQAPVVHLEATSGIGNSTAMNLLAAEVSADSTNGSVSFSNSVASQYSSLSTGAGDITVTAQGLSTFVQAQATLGSITLSVNNGTLTANEVTAGGNGNIVLSTTGAGDVRVGLITATGNRVTVNSAGSIEESVIDADIDLTASQLLFTAMNGIGTNDTLETGEANAVIAASTETGSLRIAHTGGLTVGTLGGTTGVRILDSTDTNGGGTLQLSTASPLTISAAVTNASGGNLILTAGGSAATDDLTISADVTATGGSGAILLSAGSDVIQTTGTISAAGAGAITLTAGVGTLDGVIRQEDGARLQSVSGMIDLMADEDVRLSNLQTGHAGANSVTVTSSGGAIIDNGDTDVDIIANAGTVTLNGAAGIGHGNALETTVARLAATNRGSGNFQIIETEGIQLSAVQQTSAIGTGTIEVASITGLLDVLSGGAGIGTFGSGSISLHARGAAAGNLSVNALVQTISGAITLRADNNVTFTANGDVASGSGNVVVNADDDNSGVAGGLLTMADGALINAGSGTITLTSDGDVTLGGLQTTNATATAVQVTSREGGIIDGGDSDIDISVNAAGSLVTLNAETGIGHGNALETTAARLAATNSGSGNIQIIETDGIQLSAVQQTSAIATGTIEVVSTTGLLDVLSGGAGIGTFGSGSISLQADGAAAGNLSVNALVQTISGAITLRADNNVTFTANGDVASGSGNVVVNADDDNSGAAGGLLTMADGALINAGSGTIGLIASGDIVLGNAQSTSKAAYGISVHSTAGNILDGNDGADAELNIDGVNVLLTANNVGAVDSNVFGSTPSALEVKLTGDLKITAMGAASIFGNVIGATTINADTWFFASDDDVSFLNQNLTGVRNLLLSADGDNDGQGSVLLGDSLTVSGDLALRGADIRTNRADGRLVLAAARLLIDSDAAETILLNPAQSAPGVAGLFDGRSATSLTV
ncbi:MAG: beta strand repeat-containing protein, partial [Planctomyces sp.]